MKTLTTHLKRSFDRTRDWARVLGDPSLNRSRISPALDLNYPLTYYLQESPAESGYPLDIDGVRLVRSPAGEGFVHSPTAILNFALAAYQKYLRTENAYWKDRWLTHANWIVRNQERNGARVGAWVFKFAQPDVGTAAGFINASAQGKAMSLLLRTWVRTGQEEYKSAAEVALSPFTRPASKGGVCIFYRDLYPFFETYPSEPSNFVFCGHMQAILGLWDMHIFLNDENAYRLAQQGVRTLKGMLSTYDAGFWSKYSLAPGFPNVASIAYHRKAIDLLRVLHLVTGEAAFQLYATKFEEYLRGLRCNLKAFLLKAAWRLPRLTVR